MTVLQITPKPTLDIEIKEAALKLAQRVLADVEGGNVSTLLVIAEHPVGTWSRASTGTMKIAEMIGRLEITKQEWIKAYSKQNRSKS